MSTQNTLALVEMEMITSTTSGQVIVILLRLVNKVAMKTKDV